MIFSVFDGYAGSPDRSTTEIDQNYHHHSIPNRSYLPTKPDQRTQYFTQPQPVKKSPDEADERITYPGYELPSNNNDKPIDIDFKVNDETSLSPEAQWYTPHLGPVAPASTLEQQPPEPQQPDIPNEDDILAAIFFPDAESPTTINGDPQSSSHETGNSKPIEHRIISESPENNQHDHQLTPNNPDQPQDESSATHTLLESTTRRHIEGLPTEDEEDSDDNQIIDDRINPNTLKSLVGK